MDEPGEHYAKWNRQVRERQIPYNFTHTLNLVNKLNNKENGDRLIDRELVTAKAGVGGGEGVEGLSKKEKGLMDMDNSVVIAGGEGV